MFAQETDASLLARMFDLFKHTGFACISDAASWDVAASYGVSGFARVDAFSHHLGL
jgi:hypothetical protein